jgi:hypothetical protein
MTETAWARRTRREAERAAYVREHGNVCELCGNPPKSRGLSEDHDHKTGAHRGWLCFRCNRALPAYVSVAWLLKAARYLGATYDDFHNAAWEADEAQARADHHGT